MPSRLQEPQCTALTSVLHQRSCHGKRTCGSQLLVLASQQPTGQVAGRSAENCHHHSQEVPPPSAQGPEMQRSVLIHLLYPVLGVTLLICKCRDPQVIFLPSTLACLLARSLNGGIFILQMLKPKGLSPLGRCDLDYAHCVVNTKT